MTIGEAKQIDLVVDDKIYHFKFIDNNLVYYDAWGDKSVFNEFKATDNVNTLKRLLLNDSRKKCLVICGEELETRQVGE